jgi:hypothetical protein
MLPLARTMPASRVRVCRHGANFFTISPFRYSTISIDRAAPARKLRAHKRRCYFLRRRKDQGAIP